MTGMVTVVSWNNDKKNDKKGFFIKILRIICMKKIDHDLFMLEISVIKYSKNTARLKPLCKKIYNIKKLRISDIYDILDTMIYGHIAEIKRMPDVENAISVRKKATDWQEIMLYGACDALFYAINGRRAMAVRTISDLRKTQKKFEGPFLDGVEPDYKMGNALILASLYCMCASIERLGEPESVRQIKNAVWFSDHVKDYRLNVSMCLAAIMFTNMAR